MLLNSVVYPVGIVATLSSWAVAAPCSSKCPPRQESAPPTSFISSAPAPMPTNASTSGAGPSDAVWAAAWYPGWLGDRFDQITWSKYTAMTFAFGVTTDDARDRISLDTISQSILPTFVERAQANDVKALLSLGGWTGSQYFSLAVGSAQNRTLFVNAITGLVEQYGLDGIDLDWEYPNHQGIGCNSIAPTDSANFLSFLQELRSTCTGSQMILTAAASITPFAGPDGTPLTDVSDFANVFDYLAIMNYDVWGRWSTGVGPNAPLDDSCAPEGVGSAVSAVRAWTAAGFPAEKLALGVAAYGHSFHVENNDALDSSGQIASYPQFNAALQPHGDEEDGDATTDQCGNAVPVGGIFNFWGLMDGGFLNADGTAAPGIDYRFDECSQTPYVYNPETLVMVSYDDAASFAAKGQFINSQGLAGFAMWDVLGDRNDILLDSINQAMGVEDTC